LKEYRNKEKIQKETRGRVEKKDTKEKIDNIDPANPYEMIINTKNKEDEEGMICDVCLGDGGYDEDELVVCEMCYTAVH
jgi:hypothetical protein